MENDRFSGGGQGGRIQLHDWDGTVLWDYAFSNDERMQHHDIEPLPNGNVLVLAWEHVTRDEAVAAGRDPANLGENGFWPDCVFEIEPVLPDDGRVVWEWHAFDHLIQDFAPERGGHGDVAAHPERIDVNGEHRGRPAMSPEERERREELERQMRALGYAGDDDEPEEAEGRDRRVGRDRAPGDWLHSNSIDYHSELDLILLSVRHFEELWILDHSTSTSEAAGSTGGRWGRGGDLLYRWGNPRMFGRGTEADQRLFGQHDATFVAGDVAGELRVLVFNNGEGRPGGDYSSVDELLLPFDPESGFARPSGAFGPAEPAWSYTAPVKKDFFSSFISGAQRLPNGNTLVCSGVDGRFFEVTRGGEVVWDYLNPFGEATKGRGGRRGPGPYGLFRGTRLAADHPGLARLRESRPGPGAERWVELKRELRERFPGVPQISVPELARRIEGGEELLLLDVRAPREFAVSHLAGARRVGSKAEALAALRDVPRDREVVLYCSVGYRSSILAAQLQKDGFPNVRNLEGSIFEWANSGRTVVRDGAPVREVHPFDEDWGELLDRELWAGLDED